MLFPYCSSFGLPESPEHLQEQLCFYLPNMYAKEVKLLSMSVLPEEYNLELFSEQVCSRKMRTTVA